MKQKRELKEYQAVLAAERVEASSRSSEAASETTEQAPYMNIQTPSLSVDPALLQCKEMLFEKLLSTLSVDDNKRYTNFNY